MYTGPGSDINGQVEKPKLACKVARSEGITQKELQIINTLAQIPLKFQWEILNHDLTKHTGYKIWKCWKNIYIQTDVVNLTEK
jgi:hypothetical protein